MANGGPGFAAYTHGADDRYRPGALQVLTIAGDQTSALHDFLALDDRLFERFSVPLIG